MPDPIEVQKLRIRAVAAATGALAEYGIPTDVTELLLIGDPARRVQSGALDYALSVGLAVLMQVGQEARARKL